MSEETGINKDGYGAANAETVPFDIKNLREKMRFLNNEGKANIIRDYFIEFQEHMKEFDDADLLILKNLINNFVDIIPKEAEEFSKEIHKTINIRSNTYSENQNFKRKLLVVI